MIIYCTAAHLKYLVIIKMLKNIIFTGGGLKGWAYIGTIRALAELINRNDIEQVIGVSAGSMFGLYYILKIDWEDLLDISLNLDYSSMLDVDIDNILNNQSLLTGKKFMEHIKSTIINKIDPDITFRGLYKYSKILFTVSALNITDSKPEYFNYINTPDIKVLDAIQASSALPPLLPPFKIKNKWYYDGGFCNNCPVNLLDEQSTIAFSISPIPNEYNNKTQIFNLIMALTKMNNQYTHDTNSNIIYEILDLKFKDETLNMKQSRDDRFNLYMNGYINSRRVIFDNYIALPCN